MRIYFYEMEDGKCPVADLLDSMAAKMQAKILREIALLEEYGNMLRMPHSEFLEDGIFQLRAQAEGNVTRVLYFFFQEDKAILTNGFIKKTQKTPKHEIDLAVKYREDYLNRQETLQ